MIDIIFYNHFIFYFAVSIFSILVYYGVFCLLDNSFLFAFSPNRLVRSCRAIRICPATGSGLTRPASNGRAG